jgi:hypothetical protein
MSPELIRELEAERKAYGLERGKTEEERERQRQAAKLVLLMAPEVQEELLLDGKKLGLDEGKKLGLDEGKCGRSAEGGGAGAAATEPRGERGAGGAAGGLR